MVHMAGFFERWRLRNRIARATRLRRRLRKDYGPADIYTLAQVQAAAKKDRLPQACLTWAVAMYCTQADFALAGLDGSYLEIRVQISELSLKNSNFADREGMADEDAIRIGGDADGGSSGGDGGGDGGGGGD